jgi:hypothetical protein
MRAPITRGAHRSRSGRCLCVLSFVGPLLAFTSCSTKARGQECSNPLVSTCINSDTYWPHAGPQRFAAVGGTETVGPGNVGFGLVSTWQSRPIILRVASPGPGGSDQFVVDNQVNGNFLFAYGVTNNLELDFALPVTYAQSGAGTSPLTGGRGLRDTAVRDVRFGFAYAFVPHVRTDPQKAAAEGGAGKEWGAAARFTVAAPTGDDTDFAGERTAVFWPTVAVDYRLSKFFFGAELGARIRPVTEFAGARVGTQATTALGAGVDLLRGELNGELLSILLEARSYMNFPEQHDTQQSAFGISSRPNGKYIYPSEWMLGIRSAPLLGGDISFFAGGGGPIPIGDAAITAPRFRFVLAATYAPIQRDSDGDGVPDRIDKCPTRAGERSSERPGCPQETKPPETKP